MEVEGEVDERRTTQSGGINKSCLIEADRGLTLVVKLLRILLRDEAKTDAGMGMTEQADTCRVRRDGGDICTKGIHRTTHTHITGCTIQIATQKACALICILCSCGQDYCQRQGCKTNFSLHILT